MYSLSNFHNLINIIWLFKIPLRYLKLDQQHLSEPFKFKATFEQLHLAPNLLCNPVMMSIIYMPNIIIKQRSLASKTK